MHRGDNIKNAGYTIFGFVLLAAITFFAIRSIIALGEVVIYCCEHYKELSAAVAAGLLAIVSMVIGKIVENSQRIKNECRKERQEAYAELINWLLDVCFLGNKPSSDDLGKAMSRYQKQITAYGSDRAFKAWCVLCGRISHFSKLDNDAERKAQLPAVVAAAEKMILALRKDLGYRNRKIKQYDIAKLYIRDFNDIIPKKK